MLFYFFLLVCFLDWSSDHFVNSYKRPPPNTIRIIGYHSKRPGSTGSDTQDSLRAFSFYLPLPKISSQQALFGRADDSPCFRGGRPSILFANETKGEYITGHKMPKQWSSLCENENSMCLDEGSQHPYPADENQKEQWNIRRRQLLLPPWLPLSQELLEEDVTGSVTGKLSASQKTVKRALFAFLKPHKNHFVRRLICPQVLYGWDANLIQSELLKMAPKPQEPIDWEKMESRPISTIQVDFECAAPFLVIRLFSSVWSFRLYRSILDQSNLTYSIGFLIFCFTVVFWYTVSLLAVLGGDMTLTVALLVPVPFFALFLLVRWFLQKEAIYDTVGVAWALKSWSPTGLPASYSREEVIDQLHQDGKATSEEIYLQRRTDGWYILLGTREGDWLSANKEVIEEAMRSRKVGTIEDSVGGELEFCREVRDRWEGDDGVGIAR